MSTHQKTYTDELLLALRLRDVPGTRIGEALAEVESHVAETGEDPLVAFGRPAAYADEIAAALDLPTGLGGLRRDLVRPRTLASLALGGLAGWLLPSGVLGLVGGGEAAWGLPPVAAVLIGVAALAVLVAALMHAGRTQTDVVVDPRTGEVPRAGVPWWVPALLLVPLALSLLAAALGGR